MTVTLTSPVLGLAVGAPYTGNLESWLLNEGYARADADSLTDAITVTPTAAVLTGGVNALATVGTSGNVIIGTKGGVRTTVALLTGDTAAQAATKIDTALAGLADAAIVSSKLQITSTATGQTAYVQIVGGTAGVLTGLGVTGGQEAWGGDGRPAGASNTGVQTVLPAGDPSNPANREAPYFPVTEDRNVTIANDADNLNETEFPLVGFDYDAAGVDTESPSDIVLEPNELPLAGGAVVATGNDLENVTSVTVDGDATTDFDNSEAGSGVITFTAPAQLAGSYDVVFVDASGNTTVTDGLTYADE